MLPRCPPPELLEELVREILLRVPPDEPAHLVRAALVCKLWCRILSDGVFLRHYREFHGTPPLLGYLHNDYRYDASKPVFIPTTTASMVSPPAFRCNSLHILDCRHGRVLIHAYRPAELIVWDPITDEQIRLPVPNFPHTYNAGAVLCVGEDCDHLDCRGCPFLVVFVGTGAGELEHAIDANYITSARVYSSGTGLWTESASTYSDNDCYLEGKPSLLIGDALYFSLTQGRILKFDLGERVLSAIDTPGVFGAVAMKAENGGLGFVAILADDHDCIYMWSWEVGANGIASWVYQNDIGLETLLPKCEPWLRREVIGLAEGTNTIFINTNTEEGVVTLDLKSKKVRKVGQREPYYAILPYMSFCTPDLAKGILSPL